MNKTNIEAEMGAMLTAMRSNRRILQALLNTTSPKQLIEILFHIQQKHKADLYLWQVFSTLCMIGFPYYAVLYHHLAMMLARSCCSTIVVVV